MAKAVPTLNGTWERGTRGRVFDAVHKEYRSGCHDLPTYQCAATPDMALVCERAADAPPKDVPPAGSAVGGCRRV
eukprot:COSAG04_NODE_5581_length_1561_cov_8.110123_1_plen_75_part_00